MARLAKPGARPRRSIAAFGRACGGGASVEIGLVLVIFVAFVAGIVETGRLLWTRNTLQYAAEETTRYAMAHPAASEQELLDYVAGRMPGLNTDMVTLAVSSTAVDGVPFVIVEATYPFSFLGPLLPGGTVTLRGLSRMPVLS